MSICKICKHFNFLGKLTDITPIGNGNINESFKITTTENTYFLQKINKIVFKAPRKIIYNATLVLEHLRKKGLFEANLEIIKTKDYKDYYIDVNGDYWRSYSFIENSVSYNNSENFDIIYQTGKAFGRFQTAFCDFDARKLNITIENFHNTKKRFLDLFESSKIAGERLNCSLSEFNYLKSIYSEVTIFDDLRQNDLLPIRVVHNDTKCNNVLFKMNRAICVVDLDTVMPGLIAHDFGDGARSIASSANEEEKQTSKVFFDLNKFYYFAKGFLGECKNFLTKYEVEFMHKAVFVITAELSARFLTDYYIRDRYFKISYPTQNLVRAKNQIALLKDVQNKSEDIKNIIKQCMKNDPN